MLAPGKKVMGFIQAASRKHGARLPAPGPTASGSGLLGPIWPSLDRARSLCLTSLASPGRPTLTLPGSALESLGQVGDGGIDAHHLLECHLAELAMGFETPTANGLVLLPDLVQLLTHRLDGLGG